jgi:peptide/nickel transport system substrate-binding protein
MKEKERNFRSLTRREFLYLTGVATAGMTMAGIPEWAHGAEERPRYGGRLRLSERFGSPGLDAHKNHTIMDYQNYSLMYNGLTELGKLPNVEMHPSLAKSWEISKDGREYIFTLREGVKFHHGKELDSGDVKYSMERVMNPATRSPRAFAFRWIDSIHAIDKYNIKIRLKESFTPFLTTLTLHNCSIIPAGWEPTATKPAPGTGPFVFKSFVPNETTEFTRFDQYWEIDEKTGDRLPYVDSLYVKKIVDDTVRFTALRTGEIDGIAVPPMNIVAKAVQEKPIPGIFMDYDFPGSPWFYFNVTKPPFDNKKVRQAFAYAINRSEINKAVYWNLSEITNNQPFSRASRFFIPVEDREVNPARAKQLLAEAGYRDGFKTEILVSLYSVEKLACEVASGHLKEVGIEATVKAVDMAAYYPMLRKGEYGISYRVEPAVYDWDDAFYMYLHSSEIGKNNASRYSNKELDTLLEKGRAALKWEDRVAIYRRVVEIIKEDLPILYVAKSVVPAAFRDYVKGYRKGFAFRFGWHGGGVKYWWLDR